MFRRTDPDLSDVTLRHATADDAYALKELAGLDSASPPGGPTLLAEDGHGLLAAISLRSGRIVADPFNRTAGAVDLLRMRAAQLTAAPRRRLALRPQPSRTVPSSI